MNAFAPRRFVPLAVAILACALVEPAGSQSASPADIRIATIPIDSGSQAYYADDLGLFAKRGLSVSIMSFTSGPAIAAALVAGSIDIGYSSPISVELGYKRGIPFTVIAPAAINSQAHPTCSIVVGKDSPIKTGKDLDGKTVATNGLKNTGEYGPAAWVDRSGGDSSSVKFLELPFPQMPDALAAHRVDAAVVGEPILTAQKATLRVIGDCYSSMGKTLYVSVWFTTTTWANAHPDLVAKFADALREASIWANRNQSKSAVILAKHTAVPEETALAMTRSRFGESLSPKLLQPTIDILAKYKAIDAPFPAAELIFKGAR
jgi:NitT/TauT family transport system substrate-binding protein